MFIAGPAMAMSACAVRIEILRVMRARRERDLHRLAPAEDARADGGSGEDGDEREEQVPMGSMCASGLSVIRPCERGSGSPSLSATMAWPNSCTQMLSTSATM